MEPTDTKRLPPAEDPADCWAAPVTALNALDAPDSGMAGNVHGRRVVSPLQGFGQMWQKTYRVTLRGVTLSAPEVMCFWKSEFPRFQPRESRFMMPPEGIAPGRMMYIDLDLPVLPRGPSAMPLASGVLILYADELSFAVMTPQGFPVSGWNTFSVYDTEAGVVAQVQSIDRATDPLYEVGCLLMGGARRQEENWRHVLRELALALDVLPPIEVTLEKELLDSRWQWSEAKNIRYNAGLRTMWHRVAGKINRGRKK